MSYASEKEIVKGQWKRIRRLLFIVVGAIILFLCGLGFYFDPNTWKYYVATPNITERNDGELRIHFIDVGQGDATLVELPDGKIMLIDGGNGNRSSNAMLLRHLNALKIKTIDYLFLTHADVDHYGGLTKVLEEKEVKRAFLPLQAETPSDSYEKFFAKLMEEECPYVYASPPSGERVEMKLSVTDGETPYTLVVLYPYLQMVESGAKVDKDDNASSVVIWLDYQGTSALFTGDSPSETEEYLIRDSKLGLHSRYGVDITSTDILKTAHHGSDESTSEAFLSYMNVKTAIISCGENNAYNHPHQKVLTRLKNHGADVYRTDEEGSVVITATQTGEYRVETLGK